MTLKNSNPSRHSSLRKIALSTLALSVGVAGYYSISENNEAKTSDSLTKSPVGQSAHRSEALVGSGASKAQQVLPGENESKVVVQKHAAGCGCGQHANQQIDQQLPKAAPVAMTPQLRQEILSHAKGQAITFPLPGGDDATGTVELTRQENGKTVMVQGALSAPQKGRFFFQLQSMPGVAGPMVGTVTFDEGDIAYSVETGGDGQPELREKHVDGVICRGYTIPADQLEAMPVVEEMPEDHATNIGIPDYQNGVIPLSSLPTATGVIYLDFDGEEGPHQGWGSNLDAASFNLSNTQIKSFWEQVAEDFAPFNLNVTTDLQVYLDAPENSRIRCIITPTTAIYPDVGGVAFVGGYNTTGDRPCWCFYSGDSGALVASHEIGHTLGLSHDGTSTLGYYGGHGSGSLSWGPIMGAPYGYNVLQWSKGEYTDANRTQDDLFIMANNNNNSELRVDDHADSYAAASYLEVQPDDSVSNEGIIETSTDFDGFRFTTTASGNVSLAVAPVSNSPNLDILVEIVESDGATVVASANPSNTLNASVSKNNLPAGDYFLRVSGVAYGDPNHATSPTGWTAYGSLGFYRVTGTVPNAVLPDRFSIAENSVNTTPVGTVTPRNSHGADPITYSIVSGNGGGAFAIVPATGALTVADSTQLDYETVSTRYDDPATFELFVDITNTVNASLNETVRVVVELTDENEGPTIDSVSPLTYPEHQPAGTEAVQIRANDEDRYDFVTYAITAGNTGNAFAIDSEGLITFATDTDATVLSSYNLTVEVTDQGTPALTDSTTVTINLIDILVNGINPSSVVQTYFHGISGSAISDLVTASKYPNSPDYLVERTVVGSPGYGDHYGSRIRGYLIPPATGTYTFWLAMGDSGRLLLSTDEDPANTTIFHDVSASKWANYEQWDKHPEQESATVTLQAGQPYYFELLHKESSSGDWVSMAWQGPTLSRQLIGVHYVAPYVENYAPVLQRETFAVDGTISNGGVVGQVSSSDPNTGDTVGSFTILTGNASGAFAINSTTGVITVADSSALSIGDVFALEVQATDDGAPALSDTVAVNINVLDFLVKTHFESTDGFTGYSSPNHATLTTAVDNKGATWSTPDDARIWKRSDIPPLGDQCLVLGINGTETNAEVAFPGTMEGVGTVKFDYASFSSGTDVDFSLWYRVGGGAWVQAWTTAVNGLSPDFEVLPWGSVTVDVNQTGDVDLQFKVAGDAGVLIDSVEVTGYSGGAITEAIDDSVSVDEDDSVVISPLANDTSADVGYTLSVQSVTSAANGSVVDNGDETFTYTPVSGFYGPDSFGYILTDGNGGNSYAAVDITVNPVYDPASGGTDALTIGAEAAAATVEVLSNDTVDKGLTATLLGIKSEVASYDAGTSGSPQEPTSQGWTKGGSLAGVGSVDDNGSGLDAWIVNDPTTSSANITYTVVPSAAQTTEASDNGWMLETKMRYIDDYGDTASPVLIYGNGSQRFVVFFDLDANDDLTAWLVGTGGGTYTLTSGGTGADAFHDIVLKYHPATQTATFLVDGTRFDGGAWAGDSNGFNGVQFGTGSSGGMGKAAFHSVEWSYFDTAATLASGATATLVGDDSIEFDPNGGYTFVGAGDTYQDTFYYALADDVGGVDLVSFVVDVQGVDDLPAFDSDPVVSSNGLIFDPYTGTLADYGGDPDTNDTSTFSKVNGPAWLNIAADGTFSGSPTAADVGLNSFTVEVNDGKGNSAQTTLKITVADSTNLLTENFEPYDVENPSDFSVGGTPTGNWIASNTAAGGTRIFDTSNFGGTRLWITDVANASITSKGVNVGSHAHYSMSAVLVRETATSTSTVNAEYDILVGATEATATSIIGGSQALVARGDDYQVGDSKTDHVFTHNFQTATVNPDDQLFVRFRRLSGGGWFGVDDVQLDLDHANTLPVATDATFSVDENSGSGIAVGTVSGTDADANDSVSFTITSGNGGGHFAIDSGTGAITTTATALDYEATVSHALTVTATDLSGQTDAASITVNVNNVTTVDDGDADTLNDDWEMAHYGSNGSVAAADDTDGDGFTAFQEMVFGMNPTINDAGIAVIQESIIDDGGTDKLKVQIRQPANWATLNVTYALQSCDDLKTASWANDVSVASTVTTEGSNRWLTYLMPLPSGADTRKFYRCRVTVNP